MTRPTNNNRIVVNNNINLKGLLSKPQRRRSASSISSAGSPGYRTSSSHMVPAISYDNRFSQGSNSEIGREQLKNLMLTNDFMKNSSALQQNNDGINQLRLEYQPQFDKINDMFKLGINKFRDYDRILHDDAGNFGITAGSDEGFHDEGTDHPEDVYAQPNHLNDDFDDNPINYSGGSFGFDEIHDENRDIDENNPVLEYVPEPAIQPQFDDPEMTTLYTKLQAKGKGSKGTHAQNDKLYRLVGGQDPQFPNLSVPAKNTAIKKLLGWKKAEKQVKKLSRKK